jgi:tetratricopeptide (TPR) repeat protein
MNCNRNVFILNTVRAVLFAISVNGQKSDWESLGAQAESYIAAGQTNLAVQSFQAALKAYQQSDTPPRIEYPLLFIQIAADFEKAGYLDLAADYYKQATLSPTDLSISILARLKAFNYYGMFLSHSKNYYNASQEFQKGMELADKLGYKDGFELTLVCNQIAALKELGDYRNAMRIGEDVMPRLRSHDHAHPDDIISICNSLGILYIENQDYTNAEKVLGSGVQTLEQQKKPSTFKETALVDIRETLAIAQLRNKHTSAAETNLLKIYSIKKNSRAFTSHDLAKTDLSLFELYRTKQKRKAREFADEARYLLPLDRSPSVNDLKNLIQLDYEVGETKSIPKLLSNFLAKAWSDWDELSKKGANEMTKLAFVSDLAIFDFATTFGTEHDVKESVLRWKGVVLESTLPRPRVAGSNISFAQIQSQLPTNTVVFDFVVFRKLVSFGNWTNHYGVLFYSNTGSPKWLDLGLADPIDLRLVSLVKAIREGDERFDLKAELGFFYNRLFKPALSQLPMSPDRAFISPDGNLWFLPFSFLSDFLRKTPLPRLEMSFCVSPRFLVAHCELPKRKTIALFGNPNYGPIEDSEEELPDDSSITFNSAIPYIDQIRFVPLPGTLKECMDIETEAHRAHWSAVLYTNELASEAAFRSLTNIDVLHLAAHGFFLADSAQQKLGPEGRFHKTAGFLKDKRLLDPGVRSLIGLSSAQDTFNARQFHDKKPPFDNDGLLFSWEIASLKPQSPWLVTLSACDSGLSEVVSGEGLLGLSRTLSKYGAAHVLVALWPLDDSTTSSFIKRFYAHLFDGMSPSSALFAAQRDWLDTTSSLDFATKFQQAAAFMVISIEQ